MITPIITYKSSAMSNRKDYIFAPGGLNLSWAALLRDYPDDINSCYLVALDNRQLSALLSLTGLMKWAWLWGINFKLEQETWQLIDQFRLETVEALMSGCDVALLIEAVNGVAGAITDLTGAIGGNPAGDPPVTVVSAILDIPGPPDLSGLETALTGIQTAMGDIPGPADLSGVETTLTGIQTAIGEIPGPADLSGVETAIGNVNTSLAPLAGLETLLAPLEDLSYLSNLTYLERLTLLERLNNIVAIMTTCCGKTKMPDDIYIPTIFETEEEQLDYRCRAANYIWYALRTATNNMNTQYLAGVATEETQGAIATLKGIVAVFPPAWGGEALMSLAEAMLALMRGLGALNPFGNVVNSMDTNKTAFVKALYDSETDKARDAAVGTLTGLNLIDYGFLYQIFPKGAAGILDNPIDFDTPPNPVICASTGGGFGIPDDCSVDPETNEFTGTLSDPPDWLTQDGGVVMDTWHTFHQTTEGGVFNLSGLFHVQFKLISDTTGIDGSVFYTPGDGSCTDVEIYPLVVDYTYIFDCTSFNVSFGTGSFEAVFDVRFSTEVG